MPLNDYVLKYVVDADTQKAVKGFRDVDSSLGKLTGGLTSLAGPATAAAAGIAAVGGAAVTAFAAIYKLTKEASDFGSVIFDASQKTGLHAETLSAMKYAAEQSGATLEKVTSATAKFAKTVGDAGDGSKQAAKDLADLGITPQAALSDLDGSLAKVFQRIMQAKDGTEQMILAQKAFGRSGADLLPFIKSFDGDLTGLIRTAKELGVTITDDNAQAADAFGDKLDDLNTQLAAVGRTIGFAVMPQLTDLANEFSTFLVTNKNEVDVWAKAVADSFRWLTTELRRFYNDTRYVLDFFQTLNPASNKTWDDFAQDAERAKRTAQEIDRDQVIARNKAIYGDANADPGYQTTIPGMPKNWRPPTGVPASIPRVGGGGGGRRSAPKYASGNDIIGAVNNNSPFMPALDGLVATPAELKSNERERIASLQRSMAQELELFQAQQRKLLALTTQYADAQGKTEADLARYKESLDEELLQARRRRLMEYLRSVAANDEEYKNAQHELQLLDLEIETQRAEHATNEQERKKQALEALEKEIAGYKREADAIKASQDAYLSKVRAEGLAKQQKDSEAAMVTADGTLMGGIAGGLGVDLVSIFDPKQVGVVKDQADYLKDIYGDLADFAGNAIGSMVGGLAQMGAAWLSTGEFSAKAALQMISSAALNISLQSVFKGFFEMAEAAASAAIGDIRGAALHSAASSLYFKTAAIAGAIGVGAGIGARFAGGGGGGGGASGGGGGSYGSYQGQQNSDPDPYSRQTQYAYQSGRNDPVAAAVERLTAKIDSMRPGDVLVSGMRQRPGAVGGAVVTDVRRTGGKTLAKSLGMK